jgi:hypothetical protein
MTELLCSDQEKRMTCGSHMSSSARMNFGWLVLGSVAGDNNKIWVVLKLVTTPIDI